MNDFTALLAAATAANRFVEFCKPLIDKLNPTEEVRKAALTFIAVLAGIVVSLIGDLNILSGLNTNLPPLAGVLLTGVLAGLGADVINAFLDLLYGWRDVIRARAYVNYQRGDLVLLPHADTEAERKSA